MSSSRICWQLYPLGFTGAPIRPVEDTERELTHRLERVTNWVDYAKDLGFTELILGPIFESTSHGYDTLDFFSIDRRLGDTSDFEALAAACKDKGMGLVLDGVFNHVGKHHRLVRRALSEGPEGEYAGMFNIDFSVHPPAPRLFEGHDALVEFNHADPRVTDLVADVMIHWLDKGATGWRLDAVYAIPADFWPPVIEKVRAAHPEAYIFGEMIHGDYASYVSTSGIDSVTEYEMWKAVWSSLKEENFYELQWTVGRHNTFCETYTPVTFVGNHDTTRIATYVGQNKAVLAAVMLYMFPGVPVVYYGDERAWQGVKEERLGGDDAVRPVYPSTPEGLCDSRQWMAAIHKSLATIRHDRPWLESSVIEEKEISNTRYVVDLVERADNPRRVTVSLDISGAPTAVISEGERELFSWYS